MRLLVDGDGCPDLLGIKELACKYGIEMIVFVDYAHCINDDYFRVINCDVGKDCTDLRLLAYLEVGDIVITQDYGLAQLSLLNKAQVLHVSGRLIDDDNIAQLLLQRFLSGKARRCQRRVKGPKARKQSIQDYFLKQLDSLLQKGM